MDDLEARLNGLPGRLGSKAAPIEIEDDDEVEVVEEKRVEEEEEVEGAVDAEGEDSEGGPPMVGATWVGED